MGDVGGGNGSRFFAAGLAFSAAADPGLMIIGHLPVNRQTLIVFKLLRVRLESSSIYV